MIQALLAKEFQHAWKLMAGFALAGLALSAFCVVRFPPGHEKLEVVRAGVSALAAAAGMGFAYSVVIAERKRRHLVLLRILPVSDRLHVWVKFVAALAMSASVLAATELPWLAAGMGVNPPVALGTGVAVGFYISLTLLLAITFRNPTAGILPFYVVLMGMVLMRDRLAPVLALVSELAFLAVPLSLVVTVVSVELAALVMSRRELDL
jgi:hypothetical protein